VQLRKIARFLILLLWKKENSFDLMPWRNWAGSVKLSPTPRKDKNEKYSTQHLWGAREKHGGWVVRERRKIGRVVHIMALKRTRGAAGKGEKKIQRIFGHRVEDPQ